MSIQRVEHLLRCLKEWDGPKPLTYAAAMTYMAGWLRAVGHLYKMKSDEQRHHRLKLYLEEFEDDCPIAIVRESESVWQSLMGQTSRSQLLPVSVRMKNGSSRSQGALLGDSSLDGGDVQTGGESTDAGDDGISDTATVLGDEGVAANSSSMDDGAADTPLLADTEATQSTTNKRRLQDDAQADKAKRVRIGTQQLLVSSSKEDLGANERRYEASSGFGIAADGNESQEGQDQGALDERRRMPVKQRVSNPKLQAPAKLNTNEHGNTTLFGVESSGTPGLGQRSIGGIGVRAKEPPTAKSTSNTKRETNKNTPTAKGHAVGEIKADWRDGRIQGWLNTADGSYRINMDMRSAWEIETNKGRYPRKAGS